MSKTALFTGITRSDTAKIKQCLKAEEKYYMQGEEIYSCDPTRILKIGALTEGEASVKYFSGNRIYKKEFLKKGDAFGELFSPPPSGHTVKIFAETDSSVLFFDYSTLTRPCSEACYFHFAVLSNIYKISSERMREENFRLSLLKEKTAKEKILSFLENERILHGSSSFDIALSQAELADYLCLDRSALSRAVSQLRSEGAFFSHGKHFELL